MVGETLYQYLDLEAGEETDADDLEGAELENGNDIVEGLQDFIDDSEDMADDEAVSNVERSDCTPKRRKLLDDFDLMELRIRAKATEKTSLDQRTSTTLPDLPCHAASQRLCMSTDSPQPQGSGEGFSALAAIPNPEEIWRMALNPDNNIIRYRTRYGMANAAKNKFADMVHDARNVEDDEDGLLEELEVIRRAIIDECRPEHSIAAVWIDRCTAQFHSLYVFITVSRIAPVLRWVEIHYSQSLITTSPTLIEDISEKNKLLADFYGAPIHRLGTGWVTLNGGRYHGDTGIMMGRGLWVDVIAIPRLNVNWNLFNSMLEVNSNGKRVLPSDLPRLPLNRRPPLQLFPVDRFTISSRKPSVNHAGCIVQYYREFGSVRFAGPFIVLSCRRSKLLPAATIRADIRQLFLSANHPIATWIQQMPDAVHPYHPVLPPVAHWSLEPSEAVEDLASGLRGRVTKVLEKGLVGIEVAASNGAVHSLEVPWRQIRKVFQLGDFVSVASPLQQPKTCWVIAAGTEEEVRDEVASIVERQKAQVARRPQHFKPTFVWNEEQQKKVIRYRQSFIQVISHRRNFDGIVYNEFFHVEKNACVKVEPDTYIQWTHSADDNLSIHRADDSLPATSVPNAPCLGTRIQIRYLQALAEDASNGLQYANPHKRGAPSSFVRQGFPAFVFEKAYFTGREPWLGRPVLIQGGEYKGRMGHVCGVSVHKWEAKAAAELNASDSSLVRADQRSMKTSESWLWVRVTLYEGGRSTRHDVTVKYDHIVDDKTGAPLRIIRPLTSLQAKAGYVGNRAFYRDEASRIFMLNGRGMKIRVIEGTSSAEPIRAEMPPTPSSIPPRFQTPPPQLAEPSTLWYAKDFLVGWDLRAIDSRSKATRPQSIVVRVQQSSLGVIEMYRVRGDGTLYPEPLDGSRYRSLLPGKKPNILGRWVCIKGQHEGTFVRGVRIQHRASTAFEVSNENDMDWFCFVVTPRRGAKDVEMNIDLLVHNEDMVVMADDAETLRVNAEYSSRKQGSRETGRGVFADGSRRM